LVRESQFQKAELKRTMARWQQRVTEYEAALAPLKASIVAMKEERKRRSAALQRWLFEQFKVLNANGKEKSLLDIFAEYSGIIPPGGAGECAAPKLLQYAYLNSLTPIAVAEFWVGASPHGEVRRDGCFYGACKSKCEPILGFMLQGLDVEENALEKGCDISNINIVYEDDHILVVDKPSGVLSVPGIMGGTSVQQWLRDEYLHSNELFVAHRLDMATSGLLVAAKSMEVYKELQRQFAGREVQKQYTAILDGVPVNGEGVIELPLAADYDNRPRQKVDYVGGKPAVTRYKVIGTVERDGRQCAVVCFEPVTGRTHQLRVHAAHKDGLDCPIVGDALYGTVGERLMLHASRITFVHPVSKENVELESRAFFVG
jgi:tRNA pseudouridine32 synthase/23S rRNA pseudouridine746 synthase